MSRIPRRSGLSTTLSRSPGRVLGIPDGGLGASNYPSEVQLVVSITSSCRISSSIARMCSSSWSRLASNSALGISHRSRPAIRLVVSTCSTWPPISRCLATSRYWSVGCRPSTGTWASSRKFTGRPQESSEVPGPWMFGIEAAPVDRERSGRCRRARRNCSSTGWEEPGPERPAARDAASADGRRMLTGRGPSCEAVRAGTRPPGDEFYYPMSRRSLTTVEAKTQSVSASGRNTYGDAVNRALWISHTRGMQPPPTGRGVRRQRSHPRGGAALGMLPPRLTVLAPHEAFTCDSESHVTGRKSGFGGQPHQRASQELGRGRLTGGSRSTWP